MSVAIQLVNRLVVAPQPDRTAAVQEVFDFDPTSSRDLRPTDAPAFAALASSLHGVFAALERGDVERAAATINTLLEDCPAYPHLARNDDGTWSLHHHPAKADLVSSWTAICAEALARVVGEGQAQRLRLCAAPDCRRAFFDTTKNGTRRFCSTTCQNRVKAAALRRRRASPEST